MARGLALAIVAALAVAVWLLISGREPETADRPSLRDTPDRPEPSADGPRPSEREVLTSRFATPPDARPDEESERPFAVPTKDGVLVRVIGHDTRQPHAAAIVTVITGYKIEPRRIRNAMISTWSLEAFAARLGDRYRCDEKGEVRVPFHGFVFIHARAGAAEGMVSVDDLPSTDIVVEVKKGPAVDVVVRHPDGSAAIGVPVAFRGDDERGVPRALTDAQGHAVLENVHLDVRGKARTRGKVAIELPLEDKVTKDIDLSAKARHRAELVLPPTGSVVVRVVDSDGAPVPRAHVGLAKPGNGFERIFGERGALTGRTGPQGAVRFPLVGLRVQLHAEAWTDAVPYATQVQIEPLVAAGEEKTCEVVLPGRITRISGRFVDPARAPLPGVWVEVDIGSHDAFVRADPEGRFSFVLDPAAAQKNPSQASFDRHTPSRATANVPLPTPLQAGHLDLGDVELTPLTLVASGRVLDVSGNPIRGARLEAEGWVTSEGGRTGHDDLTDGHSDAEGDFELRADIADRFDEVRITASTKEHAQKRSAIVPLGSRGLELRLERAARCVATVVPPDGADVEDVSAQFVMGDVTHRAEQREIAEGRWSFRWGMLASGIGEIRILCRGFAVTGHTVAGIRVPRAGDVQDARLDPLDLRQALRLVRLEVVDESGRPVPSPTFRVVTPDGDHVGQRRSPKHEHALLMPGVGHGVDVVAPAGFLPTTVMEPRAGQRVVMRRGPRVRLRIEGDVIPADGQVFARLQREDGRGSSILRWTGGHVSDTGHAPGTGTISCELGVRGARKARPVVMIRIPIANLPTVQTFAIKLAPGTLARALQKSR